MGYVTEAEAQAYLQKQNLTTDATLVRAIEAAQEYTHERTGRVFSVTAGSERYFVIGRYGVVEVVDLLHSPAPTIEVDTELDRTYATTVNADSYILLPLANKDGTPATRAQRIEPWPKGDTSQYLREGYLVKITGSYGYDDGAGDPPESIKAANLLLVARWYKRREAPLQVSSMPAFGFRRIFDEDADAKDLLEPFVHERKRRLVQ